MHGSLQHVRDRHVWVSPLPHLVFRTLHLSEAHLSKHTLSSEQLLALFEVKVPMSRRIDGRLDFHRGSIFARAFAMLPPADGVSSTCVTPVVSFLELSRKSGWRSPFVRPLLHRLH